MKPDAPALANRIERAVALARALQQRATELQTPAERRQQAELDRMLQEPRDKATLMQMTDQAFRAKSRWRVANQMTHILDVQGIPRFFSPWDRTLLRGFQTFGDWLPGVAVPLVKEHMRRESANVVLPAEGEVLREHLRARNAAGLRMNVNFLGEALLGETEAQLRLESYLEALQMPELEVLSVKISTIYSQISSIARAHTIRALADRLELLYREASHLRFVRGDGTEVPKFVYLDMEEYRDMSLTAEVFMRTLSRPGLEGASSGIALQAYIPDSARTQRRINEWARARVAAGGAPVTIRIVKGANLEMERVEASLRGWPQAPFRTKLETDANYKRMLHEAFRPENLRAVRVGVASHNLFDVAYGLILAAETDAGDAVQFEMLEGMANHQRRALFEETRRLLLYAPACKREDFTNAIGYLIRRLDENTGPENFLRHAFRLQVGSADWERLEALFIESFHTPISDEPRRRQDRAAEREQPLPEPSAVFVNEPDTDFALLQNGDWAEALLQDWEPRRAVEIALVIAGREVRRRADMETCIDPSRPGVCVGQYPRAEIGDLAAALACAQRDPDGWRSRSPRERTRALQRVAHEFRKAREDLIGAAVANTGKTIAEADPEVSEAIDFAEYYARSAEEWYERVGGHARGKGVAVVVPPWNFPIAIPCGGVLAALAAGNTVILKPATPAVLVAWELCQCFWRAGISKETLQFLPCPGVELASQLVSAPEVDAVILTGGTATALAMLRAKPTLPLSAETGGKNAMIVTALSDRDQAIKHVVHSAFSHSGQKCSATSLLLLEAEVYDDPGFKRVLLDASASLAVGSAWDLPTRIGPLIRPPSGDLERGLKVLERGESWALLPECIGQNPHLWSPGIRYGVQPGSYTHKTEFFGPVLGVMRFTRLEEAIAMVNQTGYGLTSGLQSLDEREQEIWRDGVRAGNLYINKPTVGAIVSRQPFGGFQKSAIGPGLKAGGANYVAQFIHFSNRELAEAGDGDSVFARLGLPADLLAEPEIRHLRAALRSYSDAWDREFSQISDPVHLLGEDNLRRYLPFPEIRIRVMPEDTSLDLLCRVCAARLAGARVVISEAPGRRNQLCETLENLSADWAGSIEFLQEDDDALATALRAGQVERLRYAAPERVPASIRQAAAEAGRWIADVPVSSEGRLELLWVLQEQSISNAYHRYGNLGARADEAHAEPA